MRLAASTSSLQNGFACGAPFGGRISYAAETQSVVAALIS